MTLMNTSKSNNIHISSRLQGLSQDLTTKGQFVP